ncbi:hypothetical protein Tco_1018201 [Tanacetum coccineum]|uniref:Uncharacterized protein n=1 Tax=Tanacetum coccineum TaxID=301880 RepID=A0ABQ5FTN6_9ASTR
MILSQPSLHTFNDVPVCDLYLSIGLRMVDRGKGLEYTKFLAKESEYSFSELLPIIRDDYLGSSKLAYNRSIVMTRNLEPLRDISRGLTISIRHWEKGHAKVMGFISCMDFLDDALKLVLALYIAAMVFGECTQIVGDVGRRVCSASFIVNMEDDANINTLTIEQYLAWVQDDIRPGVVKPKIRNNIDFEINRNFIRELRRKLFKGIDDEDAHEHVRRVLEIADVFHFNGVTHDAVILKVFPITLKGPALRWIARLLAGLVTTWDLLKKAFIKKYCPLSKLPRN